MKNKAFNLVFVMFLTGALSVFAGSKTEKFKVYGNCGMCEKRIEKAASSVEGVSSADWNKETKMIVVEFDGAKTDKDKIHLAIAKAGHDTDQHKATDETYNALQGCCQYERSKSETSEMKH